MVETTSTLISPMELHEKVDDDALPPRIIDVRSQEEYEAGHIPTAINIPGEEIAESLRRVDKDQPVVVYCNMQHPGNSRSERAAQQLRQLGMQARALQGGFPGWQQAGYPVARGKQGEPFRRMGNV